MLKIGGRVYLLFEDLNIYNPKNNERERERGWTNAYLVKVDFALFIPVGQY